MHTEERICLHVDRIHLTQSRVQGQYVVNTAELHLSGSWLSGLA